MKKTMILCLLWCFFAGAAKAKEVPQLANVLARQSISLNAQWNYIVDVQEEGLSHRHEGHTLTANQQGEVNP